MISQSFIGVRLAIHKHQEWNSEIFVLFDERYPILCRKVLQTKIARVSSDVIIPVASLFFEIKVFCNCAQALPFRVWHEAINAVRRLIECIYTRRKKTLMNVEQHWIAQERIDGQLRLWY